MNLEESDSFKDSLEKDNKSKLAIIISLIICACLIMIFSFTIMIIQHEDDTTEKMYIDGTEIGIPNGLYVDVEDEKYINIRTFGELLGYKYTIGEYGQYNEEKDSCYLQNNFEILAITAGAEKYTKYIEVAPGATIGNINVIAKNANGYSETFAIEKPVQFDEESQGLYVSLDYLGKMFNVKISWEEYRINIYTLNYLTTMAQNVIESLKLKEINGFYENYRALLDGFIVVGNAEKGIMNTSTAYGVVSLADGKEIISKKYDNILYIQNTGDFYITAANGTMGILSNTGEQIIAPSEFEEITLLDQDVKLYLVKRENEYGVLDESGDIIVYPENDRIGIDITPFKKEEIENSYLFFEKCIPVQKDKKFGLYDIEGNVVLDVNYDQFGYISPKATTSSGSEESVLLIPSYVGINGIVFNYNDLYGIFDANTGIMAYPAVFSKIYAITKNGEKTYYVEFDGQRINLADKLKEDNLANVDEKGNFLGNNITGEVIEEPVEIIGVENEIINN